MIIISGLWMWSEDVRINEVKSMYSQVPMKHNGQNDT